MAAGRGEETQIEDHVSRLDDGKWDIILKCADVYKFKMYSDDI